MGRNYSFSSLLDRGGSGHCGVNTLVAAQMFGRTSDLCRQIGINASGGLAAFGDGPYDKGLPAPHIARRKYSGDRSHVVCVGGNIAAVVELNSQLFDHPVAHRAEKAHGDQDEIGVHGEFAARDRLKLWGRADPYRVKALDVTSASSPVNLVVAMLQSRIPPSS